MESFFSWTGWTAVMGLAGAIGTVAAIMAAYYSRRGYRAQFARPEPNMFIKLVAIGEQPGWYEGHLTVTNRSDVPLQAKALKVKSPSTARLVSWYDGSERDEMNSEVRMSRLPIEKAGASIDLKLAVAGVGHEVQTGRPWRHYGEAVSHWEVFFLHLEGTKPRKCSLAISLMWADEQQLKAIRIVKTVATPQSAAAIA